MPNLHFTNREFPSGLKIGTRDDNPQVIPGPQGPFTAEEAFSVPDPANPANELHYKFLFWNVCGTFSTDYKNGHGILSGGSSVATAWYVLDGGGDGEGIITYAFWLAQDKVLANTTTPIASVKPKEAWNGSNSVSPSVGSGARVITARTSVDGILSAVFLNWFRFDTGTLSGDPLTVDHGVSTLALAQYNSKVDLPIGGATVGGGQTGTTLPGPISKFDPSPGDRTRLIGILTKTEAHPASDRLTLTLRKERSSVSADDLRSVQVELRADINRLQSAVEFINAKLAGN